jgi:hypothetical protein
MEAESLEQRAIDQGHDAILAKLMTPEEFELAKQRWTGGLPTSRDSRPAVTTPVPRTAVPRRKASRTPSTHSSEVGSATEMRLQAKIEELEEELRDVRTQVAEMKEQLGEVYQVVIALADVSKDPPQQRGKGKQKEGPTKTRALNEIVISENKPQSNARRSSVIRFANDRIPKME